MRPTWGYFWGTVLALISIAGSAGTDVISNHQAINQVVVAVSLIGLAGLTLNQIWPRPLGAAVGLIRHRLPIHREDQFVPLSQAALEVYEANIAKKIGDYARLDWGGGADPVQWCALLMTGRGLTVHGRRPPSTVLEIVPPDIFRAGALTDGAKRTRRNGFDSYEDLVVKRSEVHAMMIELRSSDWEGA